MFSMVLAMVVAIIVRLPALYLTLTGMRYRVESGTLLVLALFSALLGFVMPAVGFDIAGMVFRVALFTVIVMIMTRANILNSLIIVLIAAVVESFTILLLSLTPLSFVVSGMSPLTIP